MEELMSTGNPVLAREVLDAFIQGLNQMSPGQLPAPFGGPQTVVADLIDHRRAVNPSVSNPAHVLTLADSSIFAYSRSLPNWQDFGISKQLYDEFQTQMGAVYVPPRPVSHGVVKDLAAPDPMNFTPEKSPAVLRAAVFTENKP